MKKIYLIIFLFSSCATGITNPPIYTEKESKRNLIRFYSTDSILVKLICASLENSKNGNCVSDTDINSDENNENILDVYIETQIRESSSDYFLNAGKSLLTFTLGIFISNSAEVDFIFYTEKRGTSLMENKKLTSNGKVGYWGVLPIYTGFIATNLGTALNSYRKPEHLQKYCLYETPGKIREILEAKMEDYCLDYELFLKDSFYKVEEEFFKKIEEVKNI